MKSKIKNEPVFLFTALCLFFPFALILLLRSELKRSLKYLLGTLSLFVFITLLSLAVLQPSKNIDLSQMQLCITRETLSVGQSGGLIISDGTTYCTDYTVHTAGNCLEINGITYTAISPGKERIIVVFKDITRTVEITVTDEVKTDTPVFASPGGERYHRSDAKHAGKKAVIMTEEEALQSGKTPCKSCYQK